MRSEKAGKTRSANVLRLVMMGVLIGLGVVISPILRIEGMSMPE